MKRTSKVFFFNGAIANNTMRAFHITELPLKQEQSSLVVITTTSCLPTSPTLLALLFSEHLLVWKRSKDMTTVEYPNADKPSFFTKMKRAVGLGSQPIEYLSHDSHTSNFVWPLRYSFDTPAPYCPPKFESNDPALVEFFNANGYVTNATHIFYTQARYAVVKSVASPEEVEKGISLFWDLAERQQPSIKRTDPSTWEDSTWVANSDVGIMAGKYCSLKSIGVNY